MRLPPAALLDTSVLLRLFYDQGGPEQAAADAIREAFEGGRTELVLLDLSVYEFVNALVRGLGKSAEDAAAYVDALFDLDAPVVAVHRDVAVRAAGLAAGTGLSGYDAAFAAAAESLAVPLITADREIARKARAHDVLSLADLASR